MYCSKITFYAKGIDKIYLIDFVIKKVFILDRTDLTLLYNLRHVLSTMYRVLQIYCYLNPSLVDILQAVYLSTAPLRT